MVILRRQSITVDGVSVATLPDDVPMKRAIRVVLAALMLLGMVAGAGATPVMASSTDVTHDDNNCGIDNDDIDIDDSSDVIIDDSEDNDFLDLGLDLL